MKTEATARENSIQQYNKQITLLKEESELLNQQVDIANKLIAILNVDN